METETVHIKYERRRNIPSIISAVINVHEMLKTDEMLVFDYNTCTIKIHVNVVLLGMTLRVTTNISQNIAQSKNNKWGVTCEMETENTPPILQNVLKTTVIRQFNRERELEIPLLSTIQNKKQVTKVNNERAIPLVVIS